MIQSKLALATAAACCLVAVEGTKLKIDANLKIVRDYLDSRLGSKPKVPEFDGVPNAVETTIFFIIQNVIIHAAQSIKFIVACKEGSWNTPPCITTGRIFGTFVLENYPGLGTQCVHKTLLYQPE